jgi:hypothetical protein
VDDRVDALRDAQHVGHARDVGAHEALARPEVLDGAQIRQAQLILAREGAAQGAADAAGGAGDEEGLHEAEPAVLPA